MSLHLTNKSNIKPINFSANEYSDIEHMFNLLNQPK